MKLAILDDDREHNAHIAELFQGHHECLCFEDEVSFTRHLQRETVDLLILDWNLPQGSGLSVLEWARANLSPSLPVLMITSRAGDEDVLRSFAQGADDYIVKPAQPAILKARVDALLRRAYPPPAAGTVEDFGSHVFDTATETVLVGGEPVPVTSKEFNLALVLFRNLSRALSRGYLLQAVWGHSPDLPTRTLDAHASRIRLKLGLRPERGLRLSTIYSYGYRLERLGRDPEQT